MYIAGPFLDQSRRKSPKKWWLRYFAPEQTAEGKPVLKENGKPVVKKFRPYYETRELAVADKPRILAQHGTAGGSGVLSRAQLDDYEHARREAPGVPMKELARFWLMHHPKQASSTIAELVPTFLEWVKARLGEERHYSDLKSRLKKFCGKFGTRLPATITRQEFLAWLLEQKGRSSLNTKRASVNFFNWLATEAKILTSNQLAGIKKRQLPKDVPKEIEFLQLVDVGRYLRACERYDRDLVAHEIIQLFAGVRADDEMADFDGKWVLPSTRQIVIPAAIAKTEKREVIDGLEENFWAWWKHYGRDGILRPKNYEQRWQRVRILARIEERAAADELARLPIKTLRARAGAKAALQAWPWNARRRTFCTFKVAKDQSAAAAALILRHRGDAETLHNSYRGLGVTKQQGEAFFSFSPNPIARVIYPARPSRGIIRLQLERAKVDQPKAAASA